MASRQKWWYFVLVVAVLIALVALAAGLSGLRFQPGRAMPTVEPQVRNPAPSPWGGWAISLTFLRPVLFFILWVVLPISLVYALFSPRAWRRALGDALTLAGLVVVLYYLIRSPALSQLMGGSSSLGPAGETSGPTTAAGAGPPVWLAPLFMAAVFLALALWQARRWRRGRAITVLQRLARESQAALDQLRGGADLKDVVIRCYQEMSQVLQEQRGIQRQETMTPREFERQLVAAGLPAEPVAQLTRLFERVRYGSQSPGQEAEEAAVACLTAITQAVLGIERGLTRTEG